MKYSPLCLEIAVALLILAGCSNNEVVESNVQEAPGFYEQVEFATDEMKQEKYEELQSTRMTGIYTDSSIKFYWTAGDRIWINDASSSPSLNQSVRDDIARRLAAAGDTKTDMAKFYFSGAHTASSYPLRYTGNGSTAGDKVIIKAEQTQSRPNDAAHLGMDGDCGTATATKDGGRYKFTLEHKAAYLTFAPYYSQAVLANTVMVTQIKVTANENMAGTYEFNDTGLKTSAVTNASNSITLKLSSTFNIPKSSDYTKNGAIMVLAPGIYTNCTIEYTLFDSKTGVSGKVLRTFGSMNLRAGRNRLVSFDLAMKDYEAKYYEWDAMAHYWDGYSGQLPLVESEKAYFDATNTNRWRNGSTSNLNAVNSCRNCPNANELTYYVFNGDPHWDGDILWTKLNHLYKGGMWFLKKENIQDYNKEKHKQYNADYRANSYWADWEEDGLKANSWKATPKTEKLFDSSRYFFLPAMGFGNTDDGVYRQTTSGYYGAYWSSTGVVSNGGAIRSVVLHFSDVQVGMDVDNRDSWAYPIFSPQ